MDLTTYIGKCFRNGNEYRRITKIFTNGSVRVTEIDLSDDAREIHNCWTCGIYNNDFIRFWEEIPICEYNRAVNEVLVDIRKFLIGY